MKISHVDHDYLKQSIERFFREVFILFSVQILRLMLPFSRLP